MPISRSKKTESAHFSQYPINVMAPFEVSRKPEQSVTTLSQPGGRKSVEAVPGIQTMLTQQRNVQEKMKEGPKPTGNSGWEGSPPFMTTKEEDVMQHGTTNTNTRDNRIVTTVDIIFIPYMTHRGTPP